ncbi:MAG: 50S ribosomal protein L24 [Actinobacteria bacterium]|jgi:large subunit ribosomal protein L24|nr:50S ribosomal protein L24 [Actinomycetota bacterium]NDB08173.1 50S ribosomal protein L24 [Actinomycetota bacterium]NDI09456.1 50S ribosomal protein L24 [Actinomycetota bacterium]
MARIKKGDRVLVISGKDKGITGTVLKVDLKRERVIVEGVNRVKKHTKQGTTDRGVKTGGILTVEAPIHYSNVMLLDEDDQATRIAVKREDGKNIRISRRTGKEI